MDGARISLFSNRRAEECRKSETKKEIKNAKETKNECNKQRNKEEMKQYL
jgi:hypothetical protein